MSPVAARVHARRTWYLQTNAVVVGWLVVLGITVLSHQRVPGADWLMVHLLLLGAMSTAILIWSQHFADTLVRRPALSGRRSLIIRLAGHTLGALLVLAGMTVNVFPLVLAGGVLVGAVAVLHAVLLGRELRRAKATRFGSLVRYYVAAAASLAVGVALGVWMAGPATGPDLHARLYLAHIALNVFGWVGLTAVGTLLLLWPTVLRTRLGEGTDAAARTALPLLAGGVLVIAGASLAGLPLGAAAGTLVYLLGLVPVVREAVRQARQAPPTTFAGWSLAASLAWLAFSVGGLGLIVATASTPTDALTRLGWLLIPLLAGFAVQLLLGALSYLVPMVSGGGPQAGKAAAAELDRAPLFRLLVVNGGVVLYLLPLPSLVKVALSLLVFGVLLSFLVLLVRAVRAGGRIRSRATTPAVPVLADRLAAVRAAPAPRRTRSGMAVAAIGALVLAVTAGVALDPVAAGVGSTSVSSTVVPSPAASAVDLDTEPAPGFEARDAALPPASNDTHHDYTLRVGDTEVEVSPGVTQTQSTFNGTTPGPTLRGTVGDTFTITLVNDATTGQALDFQAGALAPDGPMRTIEPGETVEYSFTATRSGIWLYDCSSTESTTPKSGTGMFGALVIDPAGLDPVDREYLLVQSEFYPGTHGGRAESEEAAAPDLVVFNGFADQYQHQPLTARVGERIRFWVLDAGPNLASSFHIVGGQFDTVYSEGDYLLRAGGSTGTGGSQALSLAPAQGGFVELSFPESGTYSFLTHAMADAERGASGSVLVVP
ncbi:copper oxidase [Cryobacterium melibiosiphilum]|uniref:Copper oxidase n=1 Tax=Cryobacterium melibiosiphilum TaxID=995039 RepID=A0A3A5MLG4_9MICO|nr:multicopper oxidase domain-containing protein [Cryobacterium melibiosiphilum]RJT89831.1 copper oxidase [Cryobacterium melibiosiphilum]